MLYKTTVGDDVVDVESEAIIGLAFSKATADQLRVMKMPTAVSDSLLYWCCRAPELMDDERLTNLAAQPNWQVRSVDGQAVIVEPASFVVDIPQETIALIALGSMPTCRGRCIGSTRSSGRVLSSRS